MVQGYWGVCVVNRVLEERLLGRLEMGEVMQGVSALGPLGWLLGDGGRLWRGWPMRTLFLGSRDVGSLPGKWPRARAASRAARKIRHKRSKIENFIEVKSNKATELSPTAGAQPAAWGSPWGTGVQHGARWTEWSSPTGQEQMKPPVPSLPP